MTKDKSKITPRAISDPIDAATPQRKNATGLFMPDLRGKVREAVMLMADEGLTDNIAAKRAKVRLDSLRLALKRPAVIEFLNQRISNVRTNAAQQAYLRNVLLSQESNSDHVKADLNKWVAGVDGISPVQKVDGRHVHQVQFTGFAYAQPDSANTAPKPRDVTPDPQNIDNVSGGHCE